jgi:MSHA biogenesis protein MshM
MYLDHFKMKELPFTITPNTDFFCLLKGHQEALNTLLFSLRSGEGFIKIIGEVGSGKTLLCRKVLESLTPEYLTAYIPNPDLNPIELRKALARELGIDTSEMQDQHELFGLINQRLLSLHAEGKHVVLLIDEAQALPTESLETLRLFTNLETKTRKLIQVVLFAQPELDTILQQSSFRQLKQRISFSYYLPLMNRDDLDNYLFHRLAKAGCTLGSLFSRKSRDLLFKASLGVPRLVNILCHKALMAAYGKGDTQVDRDCMRLAIKDSELSLGHPWLRFSLICAISTISLLMLILLAKEIFA